MKIEAIWLRMALLWVLGIGSAMANSPPYRIPVASNPAVALDTTTGLTSSGLIWMRCAVGMDFHNTPPNGACVTNDPAAEAYTNPAQALSYAQAQTAADNANSANNGAGTHGINTWKLPTMQELNSLLMPENSRPPNYENTVFPNLDTSQPYWTNFHFGFMAATVDFASGRMTTGAPPATGYLLLVSAPDANLHTVTLTAGEHGVVIGSSILAESKTGTVTFEVQPDAGYVLSAVQKTSGDCLETALPMLNQITAIVGEQNCALTAEFQRDPSKVMITTEVQPAMGGNITCSPAGPFFPKGSSVICKATANAGFTFKTLQLNNSAPTTDNELPMTNLLYDRVLKATFAPITSISGTTVPTPGTSGVAGPAMAEIVEGGGSACHFDESVSQFVAAPTSGLPAGIAMPQGMLQFTLRDCDATRVTMRVTWPQPLTGARKFGLAEQGATVPSLFAPTDLHLNGHVMTYTLQDGQLGDDDWATNGVIVDPIGATAFTALAITPATLPATMANHPISVQLASPDAAAPAVFSSANLPAGLLLSPTGQLTGTLPAGTYQFTVNVADANGSSGSITYHWVVSAVPVPVPTLSAWSLVVLFMLLAMVTHRAQKTRRPQHQRPHQ
ncbi:DUF1566 domain-containing protein [Lampropedia aestuarii]|uniref:Lcl domain-containing protein n=1 Tax=Lampropedia aestuarii TaxID=2562762 RepID=UPI0024695DB3|nr:DUF1566 domain-containing protein [Lampropedia aestuarii]MDH5858881.1 DUF1566 domain-containing protein [Lampropedia aestuarii]